MVYGMETSIVTGAYKPTYNWGASHCMGILWNAYGNKYGNHMGKYMGTIWEGHSVFLTPHMGNIHGNLIEEYMGIVKTTIKSQRHGNTNMEERLDQNHRIEPSDVSRWRKSDDFQRLPSGKGKSTISMAMFNSYVSLPEGMASYKSILFP